MGEEPPRRYDRDELDRPTEETARNAPPRGLDLLEAARAAGSRTERLRLLRDAVRVDPDRTDILVAIGVELRKQSHFDDSVEHLRRATRLAPELAIAFRELGVTLGKQRQLDAAVRALDEAVRLDPDDPEALRNYGGALRRWALRDAPADIDHATLREARDRYREAAEREPYDSYALMNVAKLELMLSQADPSRLPVAIANFDRLKPLCQSNVDQRNDSWSRFDLAEAHLFSSEPSRFLELYRQGVDSVAPEHCRATLGSVLGPLEELLALDILPEALRERVQQARELLLAARANDCR